MPSPRGWLTWNRQFAALIALTSLSAVAILGDVPVSFWFANLVVMAVAGAVVLGGIEAVYVQRLAEAGRARSSAKDHPVGWVFVVTVAVAAVGSQTWFRPGTSIASGDLTPPDGLAWLSRIFESWTCIGFNLGGPSALELQIPWAAVLGTVHFLGAHQNSRKDFGTARFSPELPSDVSSFCSH